MKNVVSTGEFIFKCVLCSHTEAVDTSAFNFQVAESQSRKMGNENRYAAVENHTCSCGQEISIECTVYEYPVGIFTNPDFEINGGEKINADVIISVK